MSDSSSLGGAVVTGAGRGLGLEIARALAARGYLVHATDVDYDAARATAERLGAGAAEHPSLVRRPSAARGDVPVARDPRAAADLRRRSPPPAAVGAQARVGRVMLAVILPLWLAWGAAPVAARKAATAAHRRAFGQLGMTAAGALLLACLALAARPPAAGAATPAWTTYRHDALRIGFDPDSTSPLAPSQLWQTSAPLDGQIYGQPLVYGSLVYVATENDSIYALDSATGQVVWHRNVGTPVPDVQNAGCGDIGAVGITGTPVIDPVTNRIYAVADTWDGANKSSIHHQLVGFDLADGSPAPGLPITVDPPGSEPSELLQRPALALDAGSIIIGYGGNSGDCGNYHGWLVAAPESGVGSQRNFEVDPNGSQGAIWGSGNGPAVDAGGDIWASTGNGSSSSYGYQESVLKLDPNLKLLDNWAPTDWKSLDVSDADLGSSEPVMLPTGLVFQIGKQGIGYLLSASGLGGGPGAPVFQLPVCSASFGGGIYFGGVIYVACTDGLHALALNAAARTFTPLTGWRVTSAAIGPPILAGGLVWSVGWRTDVLYGLAPGTGAVDFSARLAGFDHFASPSAAGGGLFVANGALVTAFTIAKSPPATPPPGHPPVPPGHASPKLTHIRLRVSRGELTLTLTLSEPATVAVAISRRVSGRRVHGRCRAGRRHGRRCTLAERKLTRRFGAVAGSNSFKLSVGRLRRGRYTASIVARDIVGSSSKHHRLRFRIRRRRA